MTVAAVLCVRCARLRTHGAKGLCGNCYKFMRLKTKHEKEVMSLATSKKKLSKKPAPRR